MRVHVLVAALAVAAVTGACHRRPALAAAGTLPLNPFSVVIEHSSAGWQVQCESGCEWMKVSMSCAGCSVQVDATGIVRAERAKGAPIGFAFVLVDDGVGKWTARGIQGVAWKKLTWSCNNALCRARLDTEGVGPA